jgi:guanylate kinase
MKERQPLFLCFCGPTASGKSTICRELAAALNDVRLSVSTTTRAPRGNEVDGKEYFFVDQAEFLARVSRGMFVEHAMFNGKHYGTEKRNMEQAERDGVDLLLDIEVQGVAQMKKLYGSRVVTVFVFPPSIAELETRLRKRGTEDEEKISARLKIAREELAVLCTPGFSDYLLINDTPAQAYEEGLSILRAERTAMSRISPERLKRLCGLDDV